VCAAVKNCTCPTVQSLLWRAHDQEPGDAVTGWMADDCTMAICTQGYYDSTCKNVPPGVGGVSSMGQGCYRCANGGNCTAPDFCTCEAGWRGYDCREPICVLPASRQIISELNTVDAQVISESTGYWTNIDKTWVVELGFEYDPCGTTKLVPDGLGALVSRGNCSRPNTCSCFCRQRAFFDSKGNPNSLPWSDPLGRSLPAGVVYGSSTCIDGYEGARNEDGTFASCHLEIFVPSFLVRYSVQLIAAGSSIAIFFLISSMLARRQLRIRAMQQKTEKRKERRLEDAEKKEQERLLKKKVRS